MSKCEHGLTSKECYTCASPKYGESAPPQRKPLTEEEIDAAWDSVDTRHRGRGKETRIAFARAIERAHGIGGSND